MNKSESIQNLASALAKFQEEIVNPANTANNPFFKSKYAPLNDILNLVRPILTKNGLSIIQAPSGNGQDIIVTTMLLHSSGEWIETDPLILKADKATAQGAGSAITYARRYAVSAVLGISSEDDDDGNHATGNDKPKEKAKDNPKYLDDVTKQPNYVPYISEDLAANAITPTEQSELFKISKGKEELAKSIIARYGYKASKDIQQEHFNSICDEIRAGGKA